MSTRRATILPRFATDGQHRSTQSCCHNVFSFCRSVTVTNSCNEVTNSYFQTWDALLRPNFTFISPYTTLLESASGTIIQRRKEIIFNKFCIKGKCPRSFGQRIVVRNVQDIKIPFASALKLQSRLTWRMSSVCWTQFTRYSEYRDPSRRARKHINAEKIKSGTRDGGTNSDWHYSP